MRVKYWGLRNPNVVPPDLYHVGTGGYQSLEGVAKALEHAVNYDRLSKGLPLVVIPPHKLPYIPHRAWRHECDLVLCFSVTL